MNDRLFPARPILAVSAAVFREGRVLIVRRARAPLLGHFSLPGGVVEVGETLAAALARELMEEVERRGGDRRLQPARRGDRPRGGPGSRPFRHRLVRRPLDEGRAALKRRSRRRRLGRSGRPLTLADDAGIERGFGGRGADRKVAEVRASSAKRAAVAPFLKMRAWCPGRNCPLTRSSGRHANTARRRQA